MFSNSEALGFRVWGCSPDIILVVITIVCVGNGSSTRKRTGKGKSNRDRTSFGTKICFHDCSLLLLSFKELHDINIQEHRNS